MSGRDEDDSRRDAGDEMKGSLGATRSSWSSKLDQRGGCESDSCGEFSSGLDWFRVRVGRDDEVGKEACRSGDGRFSGEVERR